MRSNLERRGQKNLARKVRGITKKQQEQETTEAVNKVASKILSEVVAPVARILPSYSVMPMRAPNAGYNPRQFTYVDYDMDNVIDMSQCREYYRLVVESTAARQFGLACSFCNKVKMGFPSIEEALKWAKPLGYKNCEEDGWKCQSCKERGATK